MPADTALHKAAYKGEVDACGDLIDENPECVNARGSQNRTALHRAVGKEHNEVVGLLLERKADILLVDSGHQTVLHWAALAGLVTTAEILLAHEPSLLELKTLKGETALFYCAEKGQCAMISYLIEQKVSLFSVRP